MKPKFTHYTCSLCGAEYGPEEVTYTCPKDGGNLNVILDYEAIKAQWSPEKFTELPEASLWRYLNLILWMTQAVWGLPCVARVGHRFTSPHAWLKNWAWHSFGSKTKAPTPPHPSKTGPVPSSSPRARRSGRK